MELTAANYVALRLLQLVYAAEENRPGTVFVYAFIFLQLFRSLLRLITFGSPACEGEYRHFLAARSEVRQNDEKEDLSFVLVFCCRSGSPSGPLSDFGLVLVRHRPRCSCHLPVGLD